MRLGVWTRRRSKNRSSKDATPLLLKPFLTADADQNIPRQLSQLMRLLRDDFDENDVRTPILSSSLPF
jgi:hypothetical protein